MPAYHVCMYSVYNKINIFQMREHKTVFMCFVLQYQQNLFYMCGDGKQTYLQICRLFVNIFYNIYL